MKVAVGRMVVAALVSLCLLGAVSPARRAVADGGGTAMDPKMNPNTGEPPGAPVGCCCIPKLEAGAFTCVAKTTEFDCKAQCAELKDGRLPSGCKWTAGACP
jgi:hypothetical protein